MGQVIALKNKNVDQGLVELFEEMAAAARRGEARGFVGAIDQADGTQRIVRRGTMAADSKRAANVLSTALDTLCQRLGIPHPKISAYCSLPRRLRKA